MAGKRDPLQLAADDLATAVKAAIATKPKPIVAALTRAGNDVVNRIRKMLHAPGTGRVYKRGRVSHRASAPGQPPSSDTGRLAQSYAYRVGQDAGGVFLEIGSPVEYAPPLEFGTSRMRARPHLRPAIEQSREALAHAVARAVADTQREAIARMPREREV